MERIVREGSKQCDDRKDPVRDNAKSPRDVRCPIPVDRIFADDFAAFLHGKLAEADRCGQSGLSDTYLGL